MTAVQKTYNEKLLLSPPLHKRKPLFSKTNTLKPTVFIIGAQKAGTTSLIMQLSKHPDVVMPRQKELYYFSDINFYRKGEKWYLKQFNNPTSGSSIQVDASANYFESIAAASRLKNFCPNAKIIVLLRDPVQRAYSHYKMSVKYGFEKSSFKKAIALEEDRLKYSQAHYIPKQHHDYMFQRLGYRSKGVYSKFLQKWLEVFKREQIHIIQSESYFENPQKHYNEILEFLDLEQHTLLDVEARNTGNPKEISMKAYTDLHKFYKPYNELLFDMIGERYDWKL